MALCKYAYFHYGLEIFFGCGQCHVCRINKRREWTARLILEAQQHKHRCFVTLTYNDHWLPLRGELMPDDLTKFFKRLRKELKKNERLLRYFGCGEYGEQTNRPHYHALLFGVDEKEQSLIEKAWSKNNSALGTIHMGSITEDSISYVAGYVLKKGFKKNTGEKEVPEFARMSLKPGIGKLSMDLYAKYMKEQGHNTQEMQLGGDCPGQLRINGKFWPIGRYLRTAFRKGLQINEEQAKAINIKVLRAETEKRLKEIETSQEYEEEVKLINQARVAKLIDSQQARQQKMMIYNRSKVELSEKLSLIYKKGRILDNV